MVRLSNYMTLLLLVSIIIIPNLLIFIHQPLMPVIITNTFVLGYAVPLHPAQILLSLN